MKGYKKLNKLEERQQLENETKTEENYSPKKFKRLRHAHQR